MTVDKDIQAYKKENYSMERRFIKNLGNSSNISVSITNDSGEKFHFDKIAYKKPDPRKRSSNNAFNIPYKLVIKKEGSRSVSNFIEFNHIYDKETHELENGLRKGLTIVGGGELSNYSGEKNNFIMHSAKVTELKSKDNTLVFVINSDSFHADQKCKSEITVTIESNRNRIGKTSIEKALEKEWKEEQGMAASQFLTHMFESLEDSTDCTVEILNERNNESTFMNKAKIIESEVYGNWGDTKLTFLGEDSTDTLKLSVSSNFVIGGVNALFSRPLPRAKTLCHWSNLKVEEDIGKMVFEMESGGFVVKVTISTN